MRRILTGFAIALLVTFGLLIPAQAANATTACGNYLQTFSSSHTITDAYGTWYYGATYTKIGPNTCGSQAYVSYCLSTVNNSFPARVRWIAPGGATHVGVSVGIDCNTSGGNSTLQSLTRNGESIPNGSLVRSEFRSPAVVTCHLRT